MKIKTVVFIVIGCLLIIFQFLAYLASIIMHRPLFEEKSIAYFIGYNLYVIVGIILLILAYRTHQNMRRKKEKDQLANFLIKDDHSG